MRLVPSVAHTEGFVLTAAGHEALLHAEVCECQVKLEGLLVVCRDCGTVYGYMRDERIGGPSRIKRRGD